VDLLEARALPFHEGSQWYLAGEPKKATRIPGWEVDSSRASA